MTGVQTCALPIFGVDEAIPNRDVALVADDEVVNTLVRFCMLLENIAGCSFVSVDVEVAAFRATIHLDVEPDSADGERLFEDTQKEAASCLREQAYCHTVK